MNIATPSAAARHRTTSLRAAVPAAVALTAIVLTGCSSPSPAAPTVHASKAVALASSAPASVPPTPAAAATNVLPLVSLGHCSCTASTLFPAGSLAERESTTNVWQPIPYDVEGFGTDYLKVTEPGGIQLISPGGVASFEYRVALKRATSAQVTRGQAALDVTLIALPGHTPIGHAPAATAPIDVQSGQPSA